jgi:hypothetical protein
MNKIKYIMTFSIIFFTILYAQSLNEDTMDCDAGNAEACYQAAEEHTSKAYKQKDYDSKKSAQKVIGLYKKSCELGYAKGCTTYGMSYAADQQKDPSKDDAYYFQKACEAGDETGCTMLKMMTLRQ